MRRSSTSPGESTVTDRRYSGSRNSLPSWFFGFGAGIVGSRRAIEAAAFEQRLDVRIASDEILEQPERIGRSAARQQHGAETIAVLAFQSAVLLDPLDCVGVEDFAPKIRIIPGGITAGECVRKKEAAIARRDRWKIDSGLVQCFLFKHDCIRWNLGRIELVPCLVEQRGRQVLGGFITLIEFFCGLYFIEQR